MGDVQRLPNGNTIVGYSTKGVLHEVDAERTVLQTLDLAGRRDLRLHREARDALRPAAEVSHRFDPRFGYKEPSISVRGPP